MSVSICRSKVIWVCIRLCFGEDVRHVLIQPVQIIPNTEAELFHLLIDIVLRLFSLALYPLRRADWRRLGPGGHGGVCFGACLLGSVCRSNGARKLSN